MNQQLANDFKDFLQWLLSNKCVFNKHSVFNFENPKNRWEYWIDKHTDNFFTLDDVWDYWLHKVKNK